MALETGTSMVTVTVTDTVAAVTVTRPEALNALNAEVLGGLERAFIALAADASVRAITITGAGDRAFIAGADISEFIGASPADALTIAARIQRVLDAIVGAPQPVIAIINGFCLGGGFELALACDIRIASGAARFGLPEIKLGILPGGGGTVRLTKIAGSSVARMMAMTGEPIDADRAYALGLLAAVHAPETLEQEAETFVNRLAALSPFALAQLKSALNIAMQGDMKAAFEAEIKAFALCYSTEDQQEGAKAFLEKRKPVFTGR